ncbi:MAG TPA: ArgE/DapE family deacylase [bacterium]|nr:ArgE/DapE family deacylase [bacterium]
MTADVSSGTTRPDSSASHTAAVLARVDSLREVLIGDLAALVRIPTVVGREGPGQAWTAERYRALGLATRLVPVNFEAVRRHRAYCGWKAEAAAYEGRPNVVGVLVGDSRAPSLILNGHIDVVSAEPESRWTYGPWNPTIVDGRMYGRGANDMKAGLVSNYIALRAILESGLRPRGTVQLHSTIEEEAGGGGGALALLLAGYTADGFIATEPCRHAIRIGNGGIMYFRVRVDGKTAHAGNAHLGVNAAVKMAPILLALSRLDEARAQRHEGSPFAEGSRGRACHLSVGSVRAGDWPSTVAGWAEIEARVGYLPGETRESVRAEVVNACRQAVEDDPWMRDHPPAIEWFGWDAEPWQEDPRQQFITTLAETGREVLGHPIETFSRTSGVDSRFPHYFGFPGVCWGHRGDNNHGVDEWTDLDSVMQSTKVIALMIMKWCGVVAA